MKNLFLLVLAITSFSRFFGQSSVFATPKKDSTERHSFLKAGIDYYSDNVYLGRKDADRQSIIMPTLGYFHKSGLYAVAGAGYIPQPGYQRFDFMQFEAGYQYSGEKCYASAAFAKYRFDDSSNAINSSISSALQFYADYDLNILTIGTGFDISFSEGTDIIVSPVVCHPVYLDKDHLVINPQAQLFAGTRNFYQSYLSPANGKRHSRSSHGNGHGNSGNTGIGNTNSKITVTSTNEFKIMDYEFSIPLEYSVKHFTFNVNPEYIIPVNPATLAEDNVITKESLKDSFVLVAGISYKIGHHS